LGNVGIDPPIFIPINRLWWVVTISRRWWASGLVHDNCRATSRRLYLV